MMDDEVEDMVGEVQCTDSQKSVTTSAAYSQDFTDSSPERHNSSGKQTYVLDCDDSDDSELTFRIHGDQSLINQNEPPQPDMQQLLYHEINKSIRANFKRHTLTNEFTQTSKTIIELAQTEVIVVHKPNITSSLETQTSFVSLAEHKAMDNSKIMVNDYVNNTNEVKHNFNKDMNDIKKLFLQQSPDQITKEQILTKIQSENNSTDEKSLTEGNSVSIYKGPEPENKTVLNSEHSSEDHIITFIDDESKENENQKQENETTSEFESSRYDSDIDEDSLMETEYRSSRRSKGDNASDTSEMQKSIDIDVDELYNKLSESPLWRPPEINNTEPCPLKFGTLTPLSEETSQKKSCLDMTTSSQTIMEPTKDTDNETLFVHNDGVKVKIFSNNGDVRKNDKFNLPPILNKSCPNSPHLNFLFTVNTNPTRPLVKAGTLPYLFEGCNKESWQNGPRVLASGESPLITGRSDPVKTPRGSVFLPPIHMEGAIYHNANKPTSFVSPHEAVTTPEKTLDAISIRSKIRELKTMTDNKTRSRAVSRNCSPTSASSRPERLSDVAERGCDNLCVELLRRLRSSSWVEVLETLEDLPKSLEKNWTVVTVNRTAEMLRQVMVHIDCPRTQVASSACHVLSVILKNTNYTRKPDFYEGVSVLLTKTGSFSRPVRRAANVALDDIACGVDVTHVATALCVYGVGHKSPLVRCASARLLVVCCALAGGGRQILRARPTTAANARRHVLRALAVLLQDKNVDTRKYAERLYAILRPLPTFEAYFLTDVDVELAARHMKKYDLMLLPRRRDR